MIVALLFACGTSVVEPTPVVEPEVVETRIRDATRYRRGAAAIVAHGEPCVVERVHMDSGDRIPLFTTDGACPEHCAFEARMAVCSQGTAMVRHAYGSHSLTLVDEPVLAAVERVFIAEDGVSHVLTLADGVLAEREILVTGSRELRSQPVDELGIRGLQVGLSRRGFDLDSIQADCPTGMCRGFGEVLPEALMAYTARHGVTPGHSLLLPDQPVLFREVEGVPHGPIELCNDAACTTAVPIEVPEGPVRLVRHPPFLLVQAGGTARVIGLEEAPSRDLGPATWSTFLPFDLSL